VIRCLLKHSGTIIIIVVNDSQAPDAISLASLSRDFSNRNIFLINAVRRFACRAEHFLRFCRQKMESRSTEEEKMPHDQDEIVKHARDHAWDWFDLHAGQRMQSFNYFIVATAFLTAGSASLLEKHPEIAVGVALMGAWIAIWFNRLDRRTKQLSRAGENALEVTQARYASTSG